MAKSILVTGGAGFIGSAFVRHVYAAYPDYRLIVLDALTYAGNVKNLPVDLTTYQGDQVAFWYGDVTNGELVDTLVSRADWVVHFAAETHVTRSIYDNRIFFLTDVMGTQTVANAVLKHRRSVERFIHVSTSEVYGTAREVTMDEQHVLMPTSPYAAAKAGADRLVYSYWETYGVPCVIVRPFNQYGPCQHLEKAVPRFITSCILSEPIRLHGDGSASRDYLHVDDTCRALDLLLHCDLGDVVGEVFNVASGCDRSMLSVAQDVQRLSGCSGSEIEYVGDRPGQVFRHTGDYGKIERVLGWRPEVDWEKGLRDTMDWYRQNRDWWQSQLWMRSIPIITKTGRLEFH
jgi:dTDP-glucose 4,6-dehydratase